MDTAALREKYAALEALRRARLSAPNDEPPIDALRALSRRFPGALRELERMPLPTIVARGEVLDEVLAGTRGEPLWSVAQRSYHDALARALAGAPSPERGKERLTVWATARVAEALAIDVATCRALLFPW